MKIFFINLESSFASKKFHDKYQKQPPNIEKLNSGHESWGFLAFSIRHHQHNLLNKTLAVCVFVSLNWKVFFRIFFVFVFLRTPKTESLSEKFHCDGRQIVDSRRAFFSLFHFRLKCKIDKNYCVTWWAAFTNQQSDDLPAIRPSWTVETWLLTINFNLISRPTSHFRQSLRDTTHPASLKEQLATQLFFYIFELVAEFQQSGREFHERRGKIVFHNFSDEV